MYCASWVVFSGNGNGGYHALMNKKLTDQLATAK